jgi:hypothetical protein
MLNFKTVYSESTSAALKEMKRQEKMNNRTYKFWLILHREASYYPRKLDIAFEAEADACSVNVFHNIH